MTLSETRVVQWAAGRIEEILERPEMWGVSPEAVELQLTQLLEVYDVACNVTTTRPGFMWSQGATRQEICDEFRKFWHSLKRSGNVITT